MGPLLGIAGAFAVAASLAPSEAAQLRSQPRSEPKASFPSDIPAFHTANGTSPPVARPTAQHTVQMTAGAGAQWPGTFQHFYNSYSVGPGIWKWSNALAAYDRFITPLAGQAVKLAEVGVQSGGSMLMWRTVLGPQALLYGIDINPAVNKFADAMTKITIGDQADAGMWQGFFTGAAQGPIDVLVDDGGHEAHQMLQTLYSVFSNLTPGGIIAIEDIHGLHYVESFFVPAAQYLGQMATQGHVSSVHVFPYLMVAKRGGNDLRVPMYFGGTTETVSEFSALWEAIPRHWGGHIVLENPGWGPFLTAQGLVNFFRLFGQLHHAQWYDTPSGCEHTAAAQCVVTVVQGKMQAIITGIHIYPTRLVVEIAGGPVDLQAVRHGTDWLPY